MYNSQLYQSFSRTTVGLHYGFCTDRNIALQ